jgi:hypothetical protein
MIGDSPMRDSQQDLLATLFGFWKQVADETVRSLPEDVGGLFVFLYNDALEMVGAIHDAYPREQVITSLVYAEFTGLLKGRRRVRITRCEVWPASHWPSSYTATW